MIEPVPTEAVERQMRRARFMRRLKFSLLVALLAIGVGVYAASHYSQPVALSPIGE